jgi:hypothetical protein
LLVQAAEGEGVVASCSECGEAVALGGQDFLDLNLWLSCSECRRRLRPAVLPGDGGYGFTCDTCALSVRLAELVPSWERGRSHRTVLTSLVAGISDAVTHLLTADEDEELLCDGVHWDLVDLLLKLRQEIQERLAME